MSNLLLDSDVLIDYLRLRAPAISFLESLPEVPLLSVVVIAELFSGVRDGAERMRLDALILHAQVLVIDAPPSQHKPAFFAGSILLVTAPRYRICSLPPRPWPTAPPWSRSMPSIFPCCPACWCPTRNPDECILSSFRLQKKPDQLGRLFL